jgi:hypothetical protein
MAVSVAVPVPVVAVAPRPIQPLPTNAIAGLRLPPAMLDRTAADQTDANYIRRINIVP